MVGVTIGVGEYYSRLARHAAQAVEEKTGIEVVILTDEHFASSGLPAPHHLKLRMFDFVNDESALYFDADMVCLSPWSPERLARIDALVAVAESARPLHVRTAQDWEIPPGEYFNAGVLLLNRRCHQGWLRETEHFVLTDKKFAEYDPYDQAALNITRHRLGLKLELLDRRYNWIGYGSSRLSYEVPVYMAHGLHPENKFANIDFFEGRYKPPFGWHIEINEEEMGGLKNRALCMSAGDTETRIRFNGDGTIGPPHFIGAGQYWFVHNRAGSPTLAICSEAQVLQEFKKESDGSWRSIQRLEPALSEVSFSTHA
jgi:glycosyl transferase family 8